jgi:hypothetical protein
VTIARPDVLLMIGGGTLTFETTRYRVRRYRAAVRHLHLVDAAYAFLTHLGLKIHGAQGHDKTKHVLHLPSIRQLKTDLQRVVWREAVDDVARVSHERPVLCRLEKLLAAWNRSV